MSITNGYCTLAELKRKLIDAHLYTATTLSFAASTKKISDSAKGLERFATGKRIQVSGSASNNGYYNIATGGVAAEIVTAEALVTEAAGASVTVADVTDVADDTVLEAVITAVSRLIDRITARRFFTTSEDEVRYFTAEHSDLLEVGDLLTVTKLETDEDGDRTYETVWTTGDYDLEPYNAALDGDPYTRITLNPNGDYSFPVGVSKGVKLTGKFGYASTAPAPIKEACLLQSQRIFKRKDAVFGVMGAAEMGQAIVIPKLDPDVMLMISGYVKIGIGGV